MSTRHLPVPASFPPLSPSALWSGNVLTAHKIISDIYAHAIRAIRQDDTDSSRLAFHINALSSDTLSLLQGLESENGPQNRLTLNEWLANSTRVLAETVECLKSSMVCMKSR
jgi:hypothetical protein